MGRTGALHVLRRFGVIAVLLAVVTQLVAARPGQTQRPGTGSDALRSPLGPPIIAARPPVASPLPTVPPTDVLRPVAVPAPKVPRRLPPEAPATVSALAADGIPTVALIAYRRAAALLAKTDPACDLSWTLLAGIGRVESDHGRFAGAQLRTDGTSSFPIIGIALTGRGTERITDTDHGRLDGDPVFDRAVGPMQFIPSTWAYYGADGDGDGVRNPFDINDAALAAATLLCATGYDLGTRAGQISAVLTYNHSTAYVQTVLALATFYAGGTSVVPVILSAPVLAEPPPLAVSPPSPSSPAQPDPTRAGRPAPQPPAASSTSARTTATPPQSTSVPHPPPPTTEPPRASTSATVASPPPVASSSSAPPSHATSTAPVPSASVTGKATSSSAAACPSGLRPTAATDSSSTAPESETSTPPLISKSAAASDSPSAPSGSSDPSSSSATTCPSASPSAPVSTSAAGGWGLAVAVALGLLALAGRRARAGRH
ncbi:MAG TPA: lytic murein transglycosylase [Jatrophihabitans sp.]|jgi:hypothetical protein